MKKIKAIIVDDEPLARKGLKLRLEQFEHIEITDECENGQKALESIEKYSPDVVFLDIEMPEVSGLDVVKRLQGDDMPLIVFVTAYHQYAVNAFKLHAVDYLLKPIDDDRLQETIARIEQTSEQRQANNQKEKLISFIAKLTGSPTDEIMTLVDSNADGTAYPEKIAIKDREETILVKTIDIAWIEAAGDYMCIHANGVVHVLRSTMKELEKKLNPTQFQRVHRSTIVNLKLIEKVGKHINGEYHLILTDGSSLKMSRSYRDKIKHII